MSSWTTEAHPALEATYRLLRERPGVPFVDRSQVAIELGKDVNDPLFGRALHDLEAAGYIKGLAHTDQRVGPELFELTTLGLQTVSDWPRGNEEAATALLVALAARIDATPSTEERTKLQKALEGMRGLGRDLLVDVMASVAARQIPG
jgi:hypothetical protein